MPLSSMTVGSSFPPPAAQLQPQLLRRRRLLRWSARLLRPPVPLARQQQRRPSRGRRLPRAVLPLAGLQLRSHLHWQLRLPVQPQTQNGGRGHSTRLCRRPWPSMACPQRSAASQHHTASATGMQLLPRPSTCKSCCGESRPCTMSGLRRSPPMLRWRQSGAPRGRRRWRRSEQWRWLQLAALLIANPQTRVHRLMLPQLQPVLRQPQRHPPPQHEGLARRHPQRARQAGRRSSCAALDCFAHCPCCLLGRIRGIRGQNASDGCGDSGSRAACRRGRLLHFRPMHLRSHVRDAPRVRGALAHLPLPYDVVGDDHIGHL